MPQRCAQLAAAIDPLFAWRQNGLVQVLAQTRFLHTPAMSSSATLTAAIDELSRAIDAVERAALRQASKADLVSELALMRIDRNKLAEALDDAMSRVKTLDAARVTAGEKVDGAIGTLRSLLAKEAKD
jgi:Domain of unknown function (DUF4164)